MWVIKTNSHDDLLNTAARKKDVINKKMNTLITEEKDFLQKLREYQETPSLEPDKNNAEPYPKIMGVDGGSFQIPLLATDIYFIKTSGVILEWSTTKDFYDETGEYKIVDIDLMLPPVHTQDRLTLYRQLTELRAMIKGLQKKALVMGDGSIESTITRPTHMKLYTLDTNNAPKCIEIEEEVKKKENNESALATKELIEEKYREKPDEHDNIVKIELAEKAYYIKKLLETITSENTSLTFITKTGRSNSFFKKAMPDQYILSKYTRKPGYLLEPVQTLRELIGGLPNYCGLKEISNRIYVVNGYVRYITNGPVMKIQFITTNKVLREYASPKDFFLEKLHKTSKTITDGYPFPLLIAHMNAHITKNTINMVLEALDLKKELSGRESVDVL